MAGTPALTPGSGLPRAQFFYSDVRPAIRARRVARRDDIISHLLDDGCSNRAILVECMTYAAAGMVTTREFIVMAAWHLFEHDALRARFLGGNEDDQFAILGVILRLEPVAALLSRRSVQEITGPFAEAVPAGTVFSIDIRAANGDESVMGGCPHMLDPDRGARSLSFGHGIHRCPGSQVAMQESRVFLDRLLRLPGIKLRHAPRIGWNELLMSYELRGAAVAYDPAAECSANRNRPHILDVIGIRMRRA
jgi:cytochrome P450